MPTRPVLQKQDTSLRAQFQGLASTINSYTKLHNSYPNNYFLDGLDEMTATEQINGFKRRLRQLKEQYADVTPLAKQIHEQFHDFYVEVFWNAQGVVPDRLEQTPVGEHVPLIALVPRDMVLHPALHRNNFIYKRSVRGITITAIDWSDPVLASLFYHELGHAYRHQVTRVQEKDADFSDEEAVAEEVEMHTLQSRILSVATNGRFEQLLDRIIDRAPAQEFTSRRIAVYNGVTLADLGEMDRILGIETAGDQTTRAHLGGFIVLLGLRLGERSFTGEAQQAALCQQYDWCTDLIRALE